MSNYRYKLHDTDKLSATTDSDGNYTIMLETAKKVFKLKKKYPADEYREHIPAMLKRISEAGEIDPSKWYSEDKAFCIDTDFRF